ncbi:hypothetical protein [Actinacidiphila bryophytorum]|uniref:hypothetical protein n=1 Tax=Actinacidiphila bryophytorum TaxID=1436133 RepID=UPI002176E259|nr:hypothetical protein [Actinacidiphila bryophytorum]UWE08194.1 hypothetical protein NYE86_05260 [Actinacidiphila bryophytorum]
MAQHHSDPVHRNQVSSRVRAAVYAHTPARCSVADGGSVRSAGRKRLCSISPPGRE